MRWLILLFGVVIGLVLSTPMGVEIVEFDIAPEALYERSRTGPLLFSMDNSRLL